MKARVFYDKNSLRFALPETLKEEEDTESEEISEQKEFFRILADEKLENESDAAWSIDES